MARDGESIQIGGGDEHRDFYSRFLIGQDRSGRESALMISLTPRIQGNEKVGGSKKAAWKFREGE